MTGCFGETAEIRDAKGRSTRYEYNDKGQRTALIDPEGRRTVYEYDRRGSLSKITGPAGESYRYEYDPAGRLMKREYRNGISCLFAYDRAGALSSIHYRDREGKTIHFISVLHDKSGRIVSHRENESIRYYGYDAAGRLIRVKKPDGSEETFSYDRMGNRLVRTIPAGQQQLTYGRDAARPGARGTLRAQPETGVCLKEFPKRPKIKTKLTSVSR